MLHNARARAKRKRVPFNLTLNDIPEIPPFCPILGEDVGLVSISTGRQGARKGSPTLDRIIPSLGYIPGNVRVISAHANRIKTNANAEELRKVLEDAETILRRSLRA